MHRFPLKRAFASLLVATIGSSQAAGADDSQNLAFAVAVGNGPRGIVVRWFVSSSHSVTIVRMDGTQAGPPVHVDRAATAATENVRLAKLSKAPGDIDASDFAEVADSETAIKAGFGYVDATAARGHRYRYDVAFDNGKHVVSAEIVAGSPPPPLPAPALVAVPADRVVRLNVSPTPTGLQRLRVERSSGGAFAFERSVMVTPKTPTIFERTSGKGRVQFRVSAFDEFGNVGAPSAPVDVRPVDFSRLDAVKLSVSRSGESIMLSWLPPKGAVATYEVDRAPTGTKRLVKIASVAGSQTSYLDANVKRGALYRYDVRAINDLGNLGAPSSGKRAVLAVFHAPAAPGSVTTTTAAEGVSLAWPAAADNTVRAYEIYRRAPGKSPVLVATVPATQRAFVDRALATSLAGAEYGIGLRDRFGNAALPTSWQAGRGMRASLALAPLSATRTQNAMVLNFAPIPDPTIAQRAVYRSDNGGPPKKIATLARDATSYSDPSASAGNAYVYTTAYVLGLGTEGPRSVGRIVKLALEAHIALVTRFDGTGHAAFTITGQPSGSHCVVLRRDGDGPFTIADTAATADSRAVKSTTKYLARCTGSGRTLQSDFAPVAH